MRADLFFLVLFVVYCLEAGLFLVLAPWNGGWNRLAYHMPFEALRELFLTAGFRGAVSGFGLVHLVWGMHDLRVLLVRRRRQRERLRSAPSPPSAVESSARTRLRDAG